MIALKRKVARNRRKGNQTIKKKCWYFIPGRHTKGRREAKGQVIEQQQSEKKLYENNTKKNSNFRFLSLVRTKNFNYIIF